MPELTEPSRVRVPTLAWAWIVWSMGVRWASSSDSRSAVRISVSSPATRTCGGPEQCHGVGGQYGDGDRRPQAERQRWALVFEVHQYIGGAEQRHAAGGRPAERGGQG
jgi:hypothetical protein